MLDKYIWGKVKRISPEAPVQIVNVDRETYVPGGAANVAANIASLGASAFMVSIVGNDSARDILVAEMKKRNVNTDGVFVDSSKPTIQKVRIIGHNQQLLRIDYEKDNYVDNSVEEDIIGFVKNNLDEIDAVILSDYAKGVVTERVAKKVIDAANSHGKIIVIDPKPRHKAYYKNVTLITPNNTEASEMTGIYGDSDEDVHKMGEIIMSELGCNVLVTRGENGMMLFDRNSGKNIITIPTKAKEVYDVTGAGDTVVAVLALALCSGASFKDSALLANYAAGIVVGKVGTSTASITELRKSIEDD